MAPQESSERENAPTEGDAGRPALARKTRATPKSWWKRFVDRKYHEAVALVVSIIALVAAASSLFVDLAQNQWERSSQATRLAFEAEVEATALALDQQQVQFAKSQATALALSNVPLMRIAEATPVIRLSNAKAGSDAVGGRYVQGSGAMNVVLANDGGAQAGLVGVNWVAPVTSSQIISLSVPEAIRPGAGRVALPVNLEGPSSGFELHLSGAVAITDSLEGETPYRLGRLWAGVIESAQTHLEFRFTNANKLTVPILGVAVDIPAQAISPDPPSPFVVTDADTLGQACFSVNLRGIQGTSESTRVYASCQVV